MAASIRRSVRAWLCAVLVAVAVLGVIGLMMFREGESPQVTQDQDASRLDPGPTNSVAHRPKPDDESTVAAKPPLVELTPADVMGNADCTMRVGAGHGRDMALVVVPGEDGSRFAIVDGSGDVFADTLPFRAARDSTLARRSDGSVLAGFGGSHAPRPGDSRFRRAARPPFGPAVQGVVVYQDGQVVYQNREATRFGLADDGTSYYVMEPMAGGVSRLLIRNLDLGLETHHDLGELQTVNEGNAYVVRYSVGHSEVVVQPFDFFSRSARSREFSFFPTDGSEPRRLTVDLRGLPRFVSSYEGYFALTRGGGLAMVRHEYRHEEGEVSVAERWSRDLTLGPISDDGNWVVGYSGTEVHVLDASTGETVFVHRWSTPVDQSLRMHDGRLVLGSGTGDAEQIARCRGKREVVTRNQEDEPDGAVTTRYIVDVTGEEACFADLRDRGLYRTVYDVYDLRTLPDGRPPDHYQVEYGENPHCGSGDDPFGSLEVRDNELVFVPHDSPLQQR